MTLEIELALIADHEAPFEPGPIDAALYAKRYHDRPRITIMAAPDESLASVLERAAARFELVPPPDYWGGARFDASHRKVIFYKPEDETEPIRRARGRLFWGELTLVAQDGRAIFGVHDLRTVRYADLLRSAAAGTIEGDPLRPYLILDDGWGDAPPADWATVQVALEVAWEVAKAFAVIAGAGAGVVAARKWFLDRLGRGREALRSNPEWAQRGYRPDQFEALLLTREWKPSELAPVLGCSEAQAEGVLWIMGYALDESKGRWRYEGDDDSSINFSAIMGAINYASHGPPDWEARFQEWLESYLESGEPPALETLDPGLQESPSPPEYSPSIGSRIDRLIDQLHARIARRLR